MDVQQEYFDELQFLESKLQDYRAERKRLWSLRSEILHDLQVLDVNMQKCLERVESLKIN